MPSLAQRLGLSSKRKLSRATKPTDIKSEADALVSQADRLFRRAVAQVLKTGNMDAMNTAAAAMQQIAEMTARLDGMTPAQWIKFAEPEFDG